MTNGDYTQTPQQLTPQQQLQYQQFLAYQAQQQQQAQNPMNQRSPQQGECTVRVGRVTSVTPGSVPTMRNITLYFGRPFGPNLPEFSLTYQNVGSGWPIFESQVNTLWECQVRYVGAPGAYTMELCQDRVPRAIGACPMPGYEPLCQGVGPPAGSVTTAPSSACYNHYAMVTGMKELGPQGREVTVALGGGEIGVVEKSFVVKPPLPDDEDPLYKAPLYSLWNVPFDAAGNRCGPKPTMIFARCGKEGVVGQWYPLCTLDPRISQKCQGPHWAIVTANAGGRITLKVRVDKQTLEKSVQVPAVHMMSQAPINSVWKVHLRKDDGSVCLDPSPIFVTNRCKTLTEYPICDQDPLLLRGCAIKPAIVTKIAPGAGGTKAITLRFVPAGNAPVDGTFNAKPTDPIFNAPLYSIWNVHIDKQNKVCQDERLPTPTMLKAKCTTLTEHALCKYDEVLARGCELKPGIVMKVAAAAGGTKAITLRFATSGTAFVDQAFTAKNTDPIFNAALYSIWNVPVDKQNKVCQGERLPTPTMLKPRCTTLKEHALCKYDPEIARQCRHVAAMVAQVTAGAAGTRVVKLAFNPTGKSKFTRDVTTKPTDILYHAKQYSVWNVALDKNNAVCGAPVPAQLLEQCVKLADHAMCKEDPKFNCAAEAGVVQAVVAQTGGAKNVTLLFNPGGKGRMTRVHKAEAGSPLSYARVGEVWRVYLDKTNRNVCPAPAPAKLQDQCKPGDKLAVCNKCEKPEPTPGVVTDVSKMSSGGCAITLAYLKDDKSKQVVTGVAELPAGTNCDAFKQGQMMMVLRSAEDGSFCGLQQPVTPKDNYCARPFTPANQEVCAHACTKIKCDLAGCESGQKTVVPAIAVEAPTIAGEQYVLTFIYPKGEGPSIGTLRTTDANARFIKKGQAYSVYKDAKTEALCELGAVSPMVDFCAGTDPETKMLCKAACQYVPGLCSPTTSPGGGGGLGDLSNIDLKVRLANQNEGINSNRAGGGGVPGGAYYGPGGLLYPGGNGFILPPDKYVLPVPTTTETHVIGAYPAPPPDDLLGDGPHGSRRWNPDDPPTPMPTAAPSATFREGGGGDDDGYGDDDLSPVQETALLQDGVGVSQGDPAAAQPLAPPAPAPPPPPAYQRWLWIALAVVLAALAGYGIWRWSKSRGSAQNNTEAVIFM